MNEKLPDTLAGRVQHLREKNNLTIEKLANISNLKPSEIIDIEEGKDIFLSAGIRQKLSKALKVPARILKEVEKEQTRVEVDPQIIENIKIDILTGKLENNRCPKCGSLLICKIVTMYDLEDRPVRHPKARCEKCPFQVK